MSGILPVTQTTELTTALAGVLVCLAEHGSKGRTKVLLALVGHGDDLLKGLLGADQIPAELKDLQADEIPEIYMGIMDQLDEAFTPELEEAVKATVTAALATAEAVKRWQEVVALRNGGNGGAH